jgi:hypothetical protein
MYTPLHERNQNGQCLYGCQRLPVATISRVAFDKHIIEAKLALQFITSADLPCIAWDAVEAGLDGPATRRLAALEPPTYFEVVELLPRVMDELEMTRITTSEAAIRFQPQSPLLIVQSIPRRREYLGSLVHEDTCTNP